MIEITRKFSALSLEELQKELEDAYIRLAVAVNNLDLANTAEDVLIAALPAETTWTEYYASSTVTGWSGVPSPKLIYYKKIGKIVFVQFDISGTSNSTSTSFTVPFTSSNTAEVHAAGRVQDNTGTFVAGLIYLPANSDLVSLTADMSGSGGSWTASGTKAVHGQFWYTVA